MSYKIEKVELPKSVKSSSKVYDDIIAEIIEKEDGSYLITSNKSPTTLYIQLHKRVKGKNNLKLHKIANKVYVEKINLSK